MPSRNVHLTKHLDEFVASRIGSGRYENASEVVRAALRSLEEREREYEARLVSLRASLDAAEDGGDAEGDVFAEVMAGLDAPEDRSGA